MNVNLEIEAKSLLNKEDYENIVRNFENNSYEQVNFYIDTKDRTISNSKDGLRIRYKNKEYELTLKIELSQITRKEINQKIDAKTALKMINESIFPDGDIKRCLEEKYGTIADILIVLGFATTTRTDINFNKSLLSVDKTTYNGIIDYEIESESCDEQQATNDLKAFLEKFKIEYKENSLTKLVRFLNSLK